MVISVHFLQHFIVYVFTRLAYTLAISPFYIITVYKHLAYHTNCQH